MFTDKDFKTPFCIGIFGKWGSGKTSFMHLLENRLLKDNTEPHAIPVWFNPWRNEFDFNRLNCADYHVKKELKDYEEWGKLFLNTFMKKNKGKRP